MGWAVKEARKRLSELLQRAGRQGPQTVTVRGGRAAAASSAAGDGAPVGHRPSLVDDLLSGPAWDDEFAAAVDVRAKTPGGRPGAI